MSVAPSRSLGRAVGVIVALLSIVSTLASCGTTPPGPRWHVVPSSLGRGLTLNSLNGVAAVTASNVWAVGYYDDGPSATQTLIANYNGTTWSNVSDVFSSGPRPNESVLNGVAAVSASNVWAVGYYRNAGGPTQTLIEQYDGTSWSKVSSPSPGSSENVLNGVVAVSASDLWAVGYYRKAGEASEVLYEHYDGTSWSLWPAVVTHYGPGSSENVLNGVAAVPASASSPTARWAVGYYSPNSIGSNHTLVEAGNAGHFPCPPMYPPCPPFFVVYPTTDTCLSCSTVLTGVAATSAYDAWAVGYDSGGTVLEYCRVLGPCFPQPGPDPGGVSNALNGVAAVSASDLWAVGYSSNSVGPIYALFEHYDGTSWDWVLDSSPGSVSNVLNGVAAVPASNVFWAVGRYTPAVNGATQTLVLEYS